MSLRRAGRSGAAALVLAALTGCGVPPATGGPARVAPAPEPASSVADLTDPERWPSLPALPTESLLTVEEVTAALPGAAPWNEGVADWVSAPWKFPWCDDGAYPPRLLTAAPPPRDELSSFWSGEVSDALGSFVSVHAVRWEPTGGDGVASAERWGAALRDDAAGCPGAVVLDAAGVPGEEPLLTATPQGRGSWRVQAVTTGGPTGLRLDVTTTAATAEEAGAAVAGLVTTAVGHLASADDLVGHLRDHPADRAPGDQ